MVLRLENVRYSYPDGPSVLEGLDLDVEAGEVVSLLGRSGSGKTTILNLIAGFIRPDKGRVLISGRDMADIPPRKRGVGFVFQDLALFPHMDVLGNVAYGPIARGEGRRIAEAKAVEMLGKVGLEGFAKRSVSEISGGERQRVALARALVNGPRILLMDEPLSSLDPSLREGIRRDIFRILKENGVTTVHVTHERSDALSVSDRLVVLDGGDLVEDGTPERIFWRPRTLIGARFMGHNVVTMGDGSMVSFRPESVSGRKGPGSVEFRAVVSGSEFVGSGHLIEAAFNGQTLRYRASAAPRPGSNVTLYVARDRIVRHDK